MTIPSSSAGLTAESIHDNLHGSDAAEALPHTLIYTFPDGTQAPVRCISAEPRVGANVYQALSAAVALTASFAGNTVIGPHAVVHDNVHVGEGCLIGAGARVCPDVKLGKNVVVEPGALVTQGSVIPDDARVTTAETTANYL